jgi:ribosomal protein S12 methylthiotransferase accessory factor YcaO
MQEPVPGLAFFGRRPALTADRGPAADQPAGIFTGSEHQDQASPQVAALIRKLGQPGVRIPLTDMLLALTMAVTSAQVFDPGSRPERTS